MGARGLGLKSLGGNAGSLPGGAGGGGGGTGKESEALGDGARQDSCGWHLAHSCSHLGVWG